MRSSGEMRRILQVTECLNGGVPAFITCICEGLSGDFEFGVAAPRGSALLESPPRDARVHPLEISHRINPVLDWRAARDLNQIVREGGYDLVHLNSTKAGVLGILMRGRRRVPTLFSPHALRSYAYPPGSLLNRASLAVERLICGSADIVGAVSETEANRVVSTGLAGAERVRVVENGVDLATLARPAVLRRADLGIPDDAFVVGTVGRIAPQKDPETFVRAAGLISQRVTNACFVMVGEGPMMESVRDLAQRTGVLARMRFTGWREDASEVMKLFDVFVMPSLYEGSPFTLFEAAAAGVPIVAARSPGVGGLLDDGVTGLLVPQRDERAFSDAVVRLREDQGMSRRIAEDALRRVAQPRSREVMLMNWRDLYLSLPVTSTVSSTPSAEAISSRSPSRD